MWVNAWILTSPVANEYKLTPPFFVPSAMNGVICCCGCFFELVWIHQPKIQRRMHSIELRIENSTEFGGRLGVTYLARGDRIVNIDPGETCVRHRQMCLGHKFLSQFTRFRVPYFQFSIEIDVCVQFSVGRMLRHVQIVLYGRHSYHMYTPHTILAMNVDCGRALKSFWRRTSSVIWLLDSVRCGCAKFTSNAAQTQRAVRSMPCHSSQWKLMWMNCESGNQLEFGGK